MDDNDIVVTIVDYLQHEIDTLLLIADTSKGFDKYTYKTRANEAQEILYNISDIVGM